MKYTRISGKIDAIHLAGSERAFHFFRPAETVVTLDSGITLAVLPFDQEKPEPNLLILSPEGKELARLSALSPFGWVDDIWESSGEIKIFEYSHRGQYRSRIDLDELKLIPDGEWR